MNIFNELRNYTLTRNNQGVYVLKKGNDETSLNKIFGLSTITLTPDEHQINNFAAMCYLYGLFGINVSAFTAVPAGFIATFSKDNNEYGTFFTDPYYVSQDIMRLCEEQTKEEPQNSNFYKMVATILEDSKLSLLERSLMISSFIQQTDIKKREEEAIKQFNVVNQQNCDDNHLVLEDIVSLNKDLLADLNQVNKSETPNETIIELVNKREFSSESDKDEYLEQLKGAKETFNKVLSEFILDSGYFVYRGRNKEQDGTVLNKQDRAAILRNILKSNNPNKNDDDISADIIDIYNMCSTDYSADIVYDVLVKISENNKQQVNSEVPKAENNKEEKNLFRHNNSDLINIDRSGRLK